MDQRLMALGLVLVSGACTEDAPLSADSDIELPERQFIFEGMQIEERRGDRVLWTGTGRRADGDLHDAVVQDVKLDYAGRGDGSRTFSVFSPRAHLDLDGEAAVFEQVRVVDNAGATLDAGEARYAETEGHILVDGPLTFTAPYLSARATSAVVLLDDGRVDIQGPVLGTFFRGNADNGPPSP